MLRFFLIIFTVILLQNTTLAQTTVEEKVFLASKRNYEACFAADWNLKIPVLSASSPNDVRHSVNDSIARIVDYIFQDTLNYEAANENLNEDCDTTSIPFINHAECTSHYSVGMNTNRVVSLELFVNSNAGGYGNGFGTDYYAFTIDIAKNKLLSIHDLFDSTGAAKLKQYIIENVENFNEGISLDEDFALFGYSSDSPEYGSYRFLGFIIDNKDLSLNYSIDMGRGNLVSELKIPLADIKPFITKKYTWLCEQK